MEELHIEALRVVIADWDLMMTVAAWRVIDNCRFVQDNSDGESHSVEGLFHMTAVLEQWKSDLSKLPVRERAEIAQFLIVTLDEGDGDGDGVAEAWRTELARRWARIKSGQASGRPVDDVLAELREQNP